ncbi:hypothetical protein ASG92_20495 [Arthrobacter sp. Soil736]|uniref:HTH domain-containing protein n=1 Tax=Arthrobacter sp. Soil736 TaxID=1736395 RepID=UPI0006F99DD2|nr:HTH domain-containing protein [Arthrobacter sp. Soil736]KRE61770.1 hypothetical protein ASG92_20495 [Arthrobacter sp. Soil736]
MSAQLIDNREVPKYVPLAIPGSTEESLNMLGVNALRSSILRYLAQHPEGATSGEIGRDIDVDYRTVWRYLKEIETQGGVTSEQAEGKGQSDRWRVYKLNVDAREEAVKTYLGFLRGN